MKHLVQLHGGPYAGKEVSIWDTSSSPCAGDGIAVSCSVYALTDHYDLRKTAAGKTPIRIAKFVKIEYVAEKDWSPNEV